MPEQRLLITPWGSGDGPVPGAPTHYERELSNMIVKVWPFQNTIMSLINRKVIKFQIEHLWPIRTVNSKNTTATPWHQRIQELVPITSEPFTLQNTWTCLRFAVVVTHIAEAAKKNWITDQMEEWVEEGLYSMFRGWESLIPSSSYVGPSAPNVIPQMAGIGFNAAGTGVDAVTGPKWNGDIADANSQQSQRNAFGAPWDYPLMLAGMQVLRQRGWVPSDVIVGNTNKGVAENFPHSQQQFVEPASKMMAHRDIEFVRTRYGTARIHLAILDDFPQQGVLTLDPDAMDFVVPEGMALQGLPIEPDGDHNQVMYKSMGSMQINPHGLDLLTNTAA